MKQLPADIGLHLAKLFKEEIEKPYYKGGKDISLSELNCLFINGFNSGMGYVIERLKK